MIQSVVMGIKNTAVYASPDAAPTCHHRLYPDYTQPDMARSYLIENQPAI